MSSQTVARRYSSALADVSLQRGEAREVQQELVAWADMMQSNANLGEVFANPTIALDQKRRVLNRLIEIAKPRPTTVNFLKLLLQNQRLPELDQIAKQPVQLNRLCLHLLGLGERDQPGDQGGGALGLRGDDERQRGALLVADRALKSSRLDDARILEGLVLGLTARTA